MLSHLLALVPFAFGLGFAGVGLQVSLDMLGPCLCLLQLGFALPLCAPNGLTVRRAPLVCLLCLIGELALQALESLLERRYLVGVVRRCAYMSSTSPRARRGASGRASRSSRACRLVVRCFVVGVRFVRGLAPKVALLS